MNAMPGSLVLTKSASPLTTTLLFTPAIELAGFLIQMLPIAGTPGMLKYGWFVI